MLKRNSYCIYRALRLW